MSELFRWRGSLADLSKEQRAELTDRSTSSDDAVRERTAAIVLRVRAEGDAALIALASELDGVSLKSLAVPPERRVRALLDLDPSVRRSLERAAANIESVHRAFLPRATEIEVEPGVVVGRRPDPLDSVGVYAPGGRAAYPSSVLMGVVPARVAGVSRVILCSPPGPDGAPSNVVLAAAELAGVSEVYAIGGAGAIAAMAYGTESIAPVRRIVGPGNAYVAEAKLQVSGVTGIDSPAGPSELLVIADDSASADSVARELLAQAEHDPRAAVVVVALSEKIACAIGEAAEALLASEPRRAIIAEALATRGAILREESLERAIVFRERVRAGASAARAARSRRRARARAQRRHRLPRLYLVRRIRRLHDGREPRAADGRARALVLGTVDARLRALDDVSARLAGGGVRPRT